MKKVGINRAFIGNIGLAANETPYGKVKIFSKEWWEIMHTALKTATELNIEIGIFNGPGWSQSGGPWIKPQQSMRYLISSETIIEGGKNISVILPKPTAQFQDQRVIAYPNAETIETPRPLIISKPALADLVNLNNPNNDKPVIIGKSRSQQIDFSYPTAQQFQSLTIYPAKNKMSCKAVLQALRNDNYETVKTFVIDRQNDMLSVGFQPYAPIVISFRQIKSSKYRLLITDCSENTGFLSINLSAVPQVERYPEKSLAKMFQSPLPYWNEYQWPVQAKASGNVPPVDPTRVINISSKMDSTGRLRWKAPAGKWTVMRTGMTSTLVTNAPASRGGTGLEVDKMSKVHIAYHFEKYIGEILKRIPPQDRKTFKVVVADSYETGSQNWTDNFIAAFLKKYKYDPTPYLPVFTGVVVGSQEMSDRFLWDVRRFVADNVAYQYVGGLREISHKHGLTTWLENYGHWGFPGEFLQYGGQSDEVSGEFWSEGTLGDIENRAASSAAHIYGKRKVSAESFTAAGGAFSRYPALFKQRGDRFFAEGINNTLLHVYIHQPDDNMPGVNAWFGNEFNRNNTWFFEMEDFIKYLKRTNHVLQQGLYAADVAYFIGEDAPKMTGVQNPVLPKGYSFDYINSEVIMQHLAVKDGRFVLPDGMSYKVLVLPKLETMRPELLEKILLLVKQGGVIFGPRPSRSPSLQGYPAADIKLNRLAHELWGSKKNVYSHRQIGLGKIFDSNDLEGTLKLVATFPDFKSASDSVAFIHRKLADADIYFITNQSKGKIQFEPEFRISEKSPELWDPVSGTVRPLPQFSYKNDYTKVPISLDKNESVFIVFSKKEKSKNQESMENFPAARTTIPLNNNWTLQFDTLQGGPKQLVNLDKLSSWTESSEESIRFYSGSAVYKTKFVMEELDGGQSAFIAFEALTAVAKVEINGVAVGGLWTAPYQLEITKALKKGDNIVTVTVTNDWMNRLIGDSKLPMQEQKAKVSINPYNPSSKLQPSGLIGPAVIKIFGE